MLWLPILFSPCLEQVQVLLHHKSTYGLLLVVLLSVPSWAPYFILFVAGPLVFVESFCFLNGFAFSPRLATIFYASTLMQESLQAQPNKKRRKRVPSQQHSCIF